MVSRTITYAVVCNFHATHEHAFTSPYLQAFQSSMMVPSGLLRTALLYSPIEQCNFQPFPDSDPRLAPLGAAARHVAQAKSPNFLACWQIKHVRRCIRDYLLTPAHYCLDCGRNGNRGDVVMPAVPWPYLPCMGCGYAFMSYRVDASNLHVRKIGVHSAHLMLRMELRLRICEWAPSCSCAFCDAERSHNFKWMATFGPAFPFAVDRGRQYGPFLVSRLRPACEAGADGWAEMPRFTAMAFAKALREMAPQAHLDYRAVLEDFYLQQHQPPLTFPDSFPKEATVMRSVYHNDSDYDEMVAHG